jgi:hypothetical protein
VRTIFLNTICQLIIFLYLLDNETSFMILISVGIGVLIEFWKISKACTVTVCVPTHTAIVSLCIDWLGWVDQRLFGEVRFHGSILKIERATPTAKPKNTTTSHSATCHGSCIHCWLAMQSTRCTMMYVVHCNAQSLSLSRSCSQCDY